LKTITLFAPARDRCPAAIVGAIPAYVLFIPRRRTGHFRLRQS
jgi:hypothetical protein